MLLEAITERRDRAMWFNGEPWHRDITSLHMDGTEHGAIRQRGRPFLVQGTFKGGAGLFIEAESPAAVLRQTAEDLDVLTRHYVCSDLNCGAQGADCHTCRNEFHPCPEILSLARRYGLGGRRD
jgi:hypothetical protein